MSFLKALFQNRDRTATAYLSLAVPIMMVEWIVFKCLYPYADYFTDSYSYIQAAAHRDAIGYRPIGYSLFLRMVHAVWASDTFLTTLQYVLLQAACLALFLWLVKWCGLAGRAAWLMLGCMLLNPSIAYVCNFVSSDALFIGLSLIWLVVLMGLFRAPSWGRLVLQVLLLLVIFNLRYVALFYPVVAALGFLLMRKKGTVLFKVVGIVASIGIVIACAACIKRITYKETGANVFSAFSGWQIANNALHVYPDVPVDTIGLPSPECRELALDVQSFFNAHAKEPGATTDFMWTRSSPLHQFMDDYRRRYHLDYFIAWNRVAPVFDQYGYWVIRRHPLLFTRRYLWNSTGTFFSAPLDVFGVYNEGRKTVDPVAKDWFHYAGLQPDVWSATLQGTLLAPLPCIYLLLNIVFIFAVFLFLRSRSSRVRHPLFTGCVELVSAYLLANTAFTIFAAPTVFRYQILPMILLLFFSIGLLYFSRPTTASER